MTRSTPVRSTGIEGRHRATPPAWISRQDVPSPETRNSLPRIVQVRRANVDAALFFYKEVFRGFERIPPTPGSSSPDTALRGIVIDPGKGSPCYSDWFRGRFGRLLQESRSVRRSILTGAGSSSRSSTRCGGHTVVTTSYGNEGSGHSRQRPAGGGRPGEFRKVCGRF